MVLTEKEMAGGQEACPPLTTEASKARTIGNWQPGGIYQAENILPHRGYVGFWRAGGLYLKQLFSIRGRASRSELFWGMLFSVFVLFAAVGLTMAVPFCGQGVVSLWCVSLACLMGRRLHDSGRSAHWLWLILSLVGSAVLAVFAFWPSTGDNRWGRGPTRTPEIDREEHKRLEALLGQSKPAGRIDPEEAGRYNTVLNQVFPTWAGQGTLRDAVCLCDPVGVKSRIDAMEQAELIWFCRAMRLHWPNQSRGLAGSVLYYTTRLLAERLRTGENGCREAPIPWDSGMDGAGREELTKAELVRCVRRNAYLSPWGSLFGTIVTGVLAAWIIPQLVVGCVLLGVSLVRVLWNNLFVLRATRGDLFVLDVVCKGGQRVKTEDSNGNSVIELQLRLTSGDWQMSQTVTEDEFSAACEGDAYYAVMYRDRRLHSLPKKRWRVCGVGQSTKRMA